MTNAAYQVQTPVALFIFNRPAHTARVWETIRAARPSRLFVVADAPRHPADEPLVAAARQVTEQIDWDCEVMREYATHNLGSHPRLGSGYTWVFRHTERVIGIEDDIVAHPSFFAYCDALLERYAEDERVMAICGTNRVDVPDQIPHSYYFSKLYSCWGWATWRRAWQHFTFDPLDYAERRASGWLKAWAEHPAVYAFWRRVWDATYATPTDSWDYRFAWTMYRRDAYAIVPRRNLVYNIGYGADATHTAQTKHWAARLPVYSADAPLDHPPGVAWLSAPDVALANKLYRYHLRTTLIKALVPNAIRKPLIRLYHRL